MAVDRPSPFKHLIASVLLVAGTSWVSAEALRLDDHGRPGLVAHIEAHTPEELSSILSRAESLLEAEDRYSSEEPIALILHGEETNAFLKGNYAAYRDLVDQAARLDAFNVIDIQVCETWMRDNGVEREQLPPFINTVPYGPAAERDLIEQGFDYF